MKTLQFLDLGLSEYGITWNKQESLMKEIIDLKLLNQDLAEHARTITPGYLLFVEHPPVYTLGKSGETHNLLLNSAQLADKRLVSTKPTEVETSHFTVPDSWSVIRFWTWKTLQWD